LNFSTEKFSFEKEKSSNDDDDGDVLLEREITPCSSFQVSTKAAGVILVSIAQLEMFTPLLFGVVVGVAGGLLELQG
jgi:hypothetical protein